MIETTYMWKLTVKRTEMFLDAVPYILYLVYSTVYRVLIILFCAQNVKLRVRNTREFFGNILQVDITQPGPSTVIGGNFVWIVSKT